MERWERGEGGYTAVIEGGIAHEKRPFCEHKGPFFFGFGWSASMARALERDVPFLNGDVQICRL